MKILIPLDGSKFSEAVLKPAAELVQSTGAEVHLLQVVKPSEGTVNWGQHHNIEPHSSTQGFLAGATQGDVGGTTVESKGQADQRVRQNALDYLEHIIHEYFPKGGTKAAVTSDDAAREIANYASHEKVNMIAMASHGRTGLARRVMGSVAGQLLQSHVAPIYMVHPDGLN
ncbi:MAG TPA: universal stress protein [Dehalococcoidia bacterium]|nr:universal stress protein [Dehalococcoidia bacterium]